MLIKESSPFSIQSCCFSKKMATGLAITSIAVIAYGILALIGSLHPTHALGLLGSIRVTGSGAALGIGVILGMISIAISCRKPKTQMLSPQESDLLPDKTQIFDEEKEIESLLERIPSNFNKSKSEDSSILNDLNSLYLILEKREDLVKILLDEGFFYLKNDDGESIFHLAIKSGKELLISILIKNGVDPNWLSEKHNSPLHFASYHGHATIAKKLIDHGATINASSRNGLTALHFAARNGKIEALKLLLDHGATIDERNNEGFTPLSLAANQGQIESVRALLDKGSNLNILDNQDRFPLYHAALSGKEGIITLLLDHGAKIDEQDKEGFTPLIAASNKGQTEAARVLLGRGCNPNTPDKQGKSPLHHAALSEKDEIITLLLDHGAKIDEQDKDGLTPLSLAANRGQIKAARALLDKGSNLNILDNQGRSPLYHATLSGEAGIITLLLDHGAKIDEQTNDELTPLMAASSKGQTEVVKILLGKGSHCNAVDNEGRSALHYAVCSEKEEVITLLLDHGAKIDEQDKEGLTPLLLASNQGQTEAVRVLLGRDSNREIVDCKGQSLLHHAALSGKEDVVTLLMQSNVKMNRITYFGFTPSAAAQSRGYNNIAQMLQTGLDDEHRAFSDHKLINHRFGLSIKVQYEGQEIDLSGFGVGNTFPALLKSLQSSKKWLEVAPSIWKAEDTTAFHKSIELACDSVDDRGNRLEGYVALVLEAYENGEVIILPTGCDDHATVTIIFRNYFIKGDRALIINGNDASYFKPGLRIYKMQSKSNLKEAITKLISNKTFSENGNLLNSEIDKLLGLSLINYSIRSRQHGNVCAWASSAKLAVNGFFLAQLLKKGWSFFRADTHSDAMYRAWAEEDRILAMEKYLQKVPPSEVKTTVLACVYKRLSNKQMRKNSFAPNPIMQLIEGQASQAVALSNHVKFSEGITRVARVEIP